MEDCTKIRLWQKEEALYFRSRRKRRNTILLEAAHALSLLSCGRTIMEMNTLEM